MTSFRQSENALQNITYTLDLLIKQVTISNNLTAGIVQLKSHSMIRNIDKSSDYEMQTKLIYTAICGTDYSS